MVLHIGTHKTGTTSLQQFLHDHREALLAPAGIELPRGAIRAANHVELHMLTMRPDRGSLARTMYPFWERPGWIEPTRRAVRAAVVDARSPRVLFSAEGLWWLRYDDELAALRALLADAPVSAVVFLRDPEQFLASYRLTLERSNVVPSDDPASFAYVEADSWLVDYRARIDTWERALGPGRVTVLDYDECVRTDGSVIPAFAEVLGVPRGSLPDLAPYFLNRTARDAP